MSDHCKGAKPELVKLRARPAPEYWQSLDQREHGPRDRGEFPGGLPVGKGDHERSETGGGDPDGDTTRRDFLTLMGFSAAAATMAACRAPEQKAIPIAVATDEMIPGVPNFYATTCGGCASACSLLVKQRDGRPIKIEGNELSTLFGGATCATGQATVLSLYDQERLREPMWDGKPAEGHDADAKWHDVDDKIAAGLDEARAKQAKVVLLSTTITSPTLLAVIERWRKAFPGFRHVTYDPVSASALRAAAAQAFGRPLVPHYAFDRAKVIVGIDADFLGTWLSPVEFARQYARGRTPEQPPGLHVQFEPGMSVTGSNADQRVAVAPSQLGAVAAALLARIARKAGEADVTAPSDPVKPEILDKVADQLWQHRGDSLVVTGANDTAIQRVVLALNQLLGNVGKTLDVDRPSLQRQGDDAAMAELVADMQGGNVHTLILHGVNPAYDYLDGDKFKTALSRVPLSISTADRMDETAAAVKAVCPDHHFLESWGDAEPVAGMLSLTQPLIAPLFDTRSVVDSLLRWLGEPETHYAALRDHWRTQVLPSQSGARDFDSFWDQTLERGVLELAAAPASGAAATGGDWRGAVAVIQGDSQRAPQGDRYELALFESVAMRDGKNANNPWLLEMPDPITKLSWGNVAMIAPSLARQLGVSDGDVVALTTAAGASVELPVFTQPGQHARTLSLAVGYGRRQAGKAGDHVGANGFGLSSLVRGARRMWAEVTIKPTGAHEKLAEAQWHFSQEGRPIVLETTREELAEPEQPERLFDLWNQRPMGDRSWGMTIDLHACTGCSACVIACQAENNVPVIGKDQVQRQRIMHWIRIDRYYNGSDDEPRAVHQPMMCQHCGHAPCETVCPVLATTTSSEGLNQQVYNRCIGTRYCANNCPYKVRRFNWYNYTDNPRFDYNMANPVGRLVLNPDVTVRSRGVMEKCSLCVQRIAAAKNASSRTGKPLEDGQIKTACQQVCPTDAIVFGDLNDKHSRVAKRMDDKRTYRVLEDLGTRPNVAYLKKVRNGQAT
jgi:Fe-S-cluster-containing dehydrogenase component/anaerobic selenocysteine-containing dehydrogenase